ncbi:hypothetical protein GQ651_00290 [Alphaproteobacteria bacterium GH1-50]|uniref:Uncharacterized protein n=1 Tax=Kangsaoukella pontilimi TaxID=2691042 RepID=A0A7C9M7W6_9RHOB|nr:hypothetical protein [Kangsaoukella pontilimi]MXQ06273.1 hypothetical protein [Kangsaoukella pontilimi]
MQIKAVSFFALAAGFLSCSGAMAQTREAGAPLSAIDWLSDSIAIPDPAPEGAVTPPTSAAVPDVLVAPLDAPAPDRAGLIPARSLGLQANIWGRSTAADIGRRISDMPRIDQPTLRRFFRALLLAQFDPPVDAIADSSLFLARVDKLLDMAELDVAERLIDEAGAPTPAKFRREFDIALLRGTETKACETIERTPDISPTFPARIFCLARNGEWEVAALTLGTAEALSLLDPDEEKLLLHFLDPELFEGDPLPPVPLHPSPLTFRLYEAIGERIDTETLPTAFAYTDLSENVGWKTRLRASERLARAGVVTAEEFLSQATSRKAAASGGVWDRITHVQALVQALDQDDAARVSAALPQTWAAVMSGGYGPTLSTWLARRLSGIELTSAAQHDAFEIALLADDLELAKRYVGTSAEDRSLLALAEGRAGEMSISGPVATTIKRSLSGLPPGDQLQHLLEDQRTGEALLAAIRQLADGAEGDPAAIGDALSLFVSLGLEDWARRIAIEILLDEAAA